MPFPPTGLVTPAVVRERVPPMPPSVVLDLAHVPDWPAAEHGDRLWEVAAASPIGKGRASELEKLSNLEDAG
jgi:hypothetical protein